MFALGPDGRALGLINQELDSLSSAIDRSKDPENQPIPYGFQLVF